MVFELDVKGKEGRLKKNLSGALATPIRPVSTQPREGGDITHGVGDRAKAERPARSPEITQLTQKRSL